MAALKAGDRATFNRLMEDYYGWSVSQVRKIIHDPERAKDVAVTFWEQLPERLKHYDESRPTFLAWAEQNLLNLARNTVIDRPQPKITYTSDPEDVRAATGDVAQRLSARQDLEAIAGRLKSAQHKDVFWLLIAGATAKDIAMECDLSLKRTQNLIAEVRAVIQEQLEGGE
jgi:RNA polymerase sigma factor (sigma-70 family)